MKYLSDKHAEVLRTLVTGCCYAMLLATSLFLLLNILFRNLNVYKTLYLFLYINNKQSVMHVIVYHYTII